MRKKHLAPMEIIAEEASMYEQSCTSIVLSNDGKNLLLSQRQDEEGNNVFEQSRIFVFSD